MALGDTVIELEGLYSKQVLKERQEYLSHPYYNSISNVLSIIKDELTRDGTDTFVNLIVADHINPITVHQEVVDFINDEVKEYVAEYDTVDLTQQQINDGFVRLTKLDWTVN